MIGDALNRKKISDNYFNNAYPSFMKANGPFKIYDYSEQKGEFYVDNLQKNFTKAHDRFYQEMNYLKDLKKS